MTLTLIIFLVLGSELFFSSSYISCYLAGLVGPLITPSVFI